MSHLILAYIDPGTGSYAYQLSIAGLTTIVFFFSSIKRKFRGLFKKAKTAKPPPGDNGRKDSFA